MFYILAAIFLWSSLGVVIRLSGIAVHSLIFFSSIVSVAIAGSLFLKRDLRRHIPSKDRLVPLLILGPLSLINSYSFFYSYKNTTVANAVLTHYTAPIFVALLAPIFLKERLTLRLAIAVLVSTAGLWIMLNMSAKDLMNLIVAGDKDTRGIIAGLISGIAYAFIVITFRVFSQNYHPLVLTFAQNTIIAFILFPYPALAGSNRFSIYNNTIAQGLWAVAVMGIVHSTIAPLLYFRGIRTVTANRAAILGYLEPVCAILLGFIFLDEVISLRTFIGGSMILFSGYLTITNVPPWRDRTDH
ncbi:MAG: DMT family transporter [Thermodesulfovibrionales bacterium]